MHLTRYMQKFTVKVTFLHLVRLMMHRDMTLMCEKNLLKSIWFVCIIAGLLLLKTNANTISHSNYPIFIAYKFQLLYKQQPAHTCR